MLSADGHRVHAATRPAEALELAHRHAEALDLVVSDIVMPEIRGPELVAAIRRAIGRSLPVVYVSGYSSDEVHAPEAVLLRKPFLRAELQRAIEECIARHGT